MIDNAHVRRMKVVLLVSSLASLVLMAAVAYRESFGGEWRDVQARYARALIATADDENSRRAAESFRVELEQIYLPELGRIDRCVTCHIGVENPEMASAARPLSKHPGDLLAIHPVQRFGCTICHGGRGRAVRREEAHGWDRDGKPVPHIEDPLLRGTAVYTSCGPCHEEHDLFGASQDLYSAAGTTHRTPIDGKLLVRALPGASEIAAGKRLVVESGCLGCHKYRGRGGTLGPDITYVGEKGPHDYDFSHVEGEHTPEQWLREHFKKPAEISPGTTMPDMGFTDVESRQLTLAMLALRRKSSPASHRPPPALGHRRTLEPVRGETLYRMFCSSCHGPDGRGTTMRGGLWPSDADPWGHDWDRKDLVVERRGEMEIIVPSLHHPDTLAVASDGYLRHVIERGRENTKMIGWKTVGGLDDDEITLIVDTLRSWDSRPPVAGDVAAARGDARVGGALYRSNCAPCHGAGGEGGIGVSLNSPTFLAVASDAFLRDSIVYGRPNTAMPSWRDFSAQEISDIIAFLRLWQPARSTLAGVASRLERKSADASSASPRATEISADIGRTLYRANCVMCHGHGGAGDLGPSLNTQEFLSVAPDAYLATTLIEGRPGTAMPSWRHFADADLASLILYMRTWQTEPSKHAEWYSEPAGARARGDAYSGARLYEQLCSGCHGLDAEGATGPQLGNPVFLATTSDRMLFEWIKYGKSNTEMRGFRRGGQGIAEIDDEHIDDIVAYLRSLERLDEATVNRVSKSPHGRPERGAPLYAGNCAGCHGARGEGASGPALANPAFLHFASDGFLLATMALGRLGTEMRPVKAGPQSILGLSSDEVNDVLALLRSWERSPPDRGIPHRFVIPWNLERGRVGYAGNCEGCHGVEGKGGWAPQLNNEGFLAGATDGFLQATIVRGRRGTAMRPFGVGSHGVADLPSDTIDDIVAYMRSWSKRTPSPMTIPAQHSRKRAMNRNGTAAPRKTETN